MLLVLNSPFPPPLSFSFYQPTIIWHILCLDCFFPKGYYWRQVSSTLMMMMVMVMMVMVVATAVVVLVAMINIKDANWCADRNSSIFLSFLSLAQFDFAVCCAALVAPCIYMYLHIHCQLAFFDYAASPTHSFLYASIINASNNGTNNGNQIELNAGWT